MQDEFVRNYPSLNIEIIGINESDADPIGFITDGRSMPWLNDTDDNSNGLNDVRDESWQVEYRDVVIVDENSDMVAQYNLTVNNLAETTNFAALKQLFIDTAVTPAESPWQSPVEKLDVDFDGVIAPLDALLVINNLGVHPGGVLPISMANRSPYVDPTGDGVVAPQDALFVINHLNFLSELDNPPTAALSMAAGGEAGGELEMAEISNEAESALPSTFQPGLVDVDDDAEDSSRMDSRVVDLVFLGG